MQAKGKHFLSNINIGGFIFEYTATESSKGRTFIEVFIHLFIEVIEAKSKTIIDCIYKHPKVCVSEFKNDFINPLLENLASEKK